MGFSAVKEDGKLKISKAWLEEISKHKDGTKFVVTLERKKSKRTLTQNGALHRFFQLLSDALNMAGLEMKIVLSGETQIWWTADSVKTYLWKKLQFKMFGKEHTADLDKLEEITKIHEQLMHLLGEKHGLEYIPFPNDPNKEGKQTASLTKLTHGEDHSPTEFD